MNFFDRYTELEIMLMGAVIYLLLLLAFVIYSIIKHNKEVEKWTTKK